jgi:hypothetical protein
MNCGVCGGPLPENLSEQEQLREVQECYELELHGRVSKKTLDQDVSQMARH